MAILDNGVTAMTGRQPNPASDQKIRIEDLCVSLGIEVMVLDAQDVKACTLALADMLNRREPSVAVLRSPCVFVEARDPSKRYQVEAEKCIGCSCGCDRFCARVLQCPANLFDERRDKAYIDTEKCTGCGLCAEFCPTGAIAPIVP